MESSCCGVSSGEFENIGICPSCGEHCGFVCDPDCCPECFSPSHDVNFGRGDVAIPDGCSNDVCVCHTDMREIDETVYAESVDHAAKLKRQFALTMVLTLFVGIAFGYFLAMREASALVLGAN